MQRSRYRIAATLGVAAMGCFGLSARADINGFGGFAPVNVSAPLPNGIGISGGTYTVTDGQNGEASSAWDPTAQAISGFAASYTYQTIPQYGYGTYGISLQADGSTLAFQSPTTGSTTALGGGGGSLGYAGITTNSAAVGFELYDGYYDYQGGSELLTGGNQGPLNALSNVDLSSGDQVVVRVTYAGSTLTQTVADLATGAASTQSYTGLNLGSTLGSSTAIVGVTGGTGGYNSTQTVSNLKFNSTGTFSPVAVAGFNQAMIVPAGGSTSQLTATMDSGTALAGATFYETGYPGSTAGSGLPASGSTFVSQNDPNHVFQMPSYSAADALLINTANPTGSLYFNTPRSAGDLSILMADGNGTEPFDVTVHFMDGATEVIDGAVSPDWFYNGTVAWDAEGRIYADDASLENDGTNPNLYQVDLPLTDQTDPIAYLTFAYEGSSTSTSNMAIYAVSATPGVAVPEPASLGLLGLAGLAMIRRRR